MDQPENPIPSERALVENELITPEKVAEYAQGKVPLLLMHASLGWLDHKYPTAQQPRHTRASSLPQALAMAQAMERKIPLSPEDKAICLQGLEAAYKKLDSDIWHIQTTLLIQGADEEIGEARTHALKTSRLNGLFSYAAASLLEGREVANVQITPFKEDREYLQSEIFIRPHKNIENKVSRIQNLTSAAITNADITLRKSIYNNTVGTLEKIVVEMAKGPLTLIPARMIYAYSNHVTEQSVKQLDVLTPFFLQAAERNVDLVK